MGALEALIESGADPITRPYVNYSGAPITLSSPSRSVPSATTTTVCSGVS
jgi:hypothetical protein